MGRVVKGLIILLSFIGSLVVSSPPLQPRSYLTQPWTRRPLPLTWGSKVYPFSSTMWSKMAPFWNKMAPNWDKVVPYWNKMTPNWEKMVPYWNKMGFSWDKIAEKWQFSPSKNWKKLANNVASNLKIKSKIKELQKVKHKTVTQVKQKLKTLGDQNSLVDLKLTKDKLGKILDLAGVIPTKKPLAEIRTQLSQLGRRYGEGRPLSGASSVVMDWLTNLAQSWLHHNWSTSREDEHSGQEDKQKDAQPVPELCAESGFGSETHHVVTQDGYILAIHRIMEKSDTSSQKPVVFLQHGLLDSSAGWIIGDKTKALGFLLASGGWDVWLGNFRGNVYSRNHTQIQPDTQEFWMFSFDEMGSFDLPAMLTYVLQQTNEKKLVYIGHSMGTTAFWVMMNRFPAMNHLINLMVGLAPVATVQHMTSPIRYIAPVAEEVEKILSMTGQYEFWSHGSFMTSLSKSFCNEVGNNVTEDMCTIPEMIIFTLTGFDSHQMNYTLLPTILGHLPAGTSSRTVLHFAQGISSGKFQAFDYGSSAQNLGIYGAPTPTEYDLSLVTCPVLLYWGANDWLTHASDVKYLNQQLPNLVDSIQVPYSAWNHLDFLWGKDANTFLYKPIMKVMSKFQ